MIGSKLSHYVVEALVGEGGMGKVYRATDTILNRTVAIKVLSEVPLPDGESKRRLLHEARAASALNHPNVVTIHSVESERGLDFIVMEHVSGSALEIPAGGLPIDVALDYAIQIAAALSAAHDAGIIHRDVKPANVLVTRTGHLKVLDFGIARRVEMQGEAPTRQFTADATVGSPGVVVGTIGYLSPEQIAGQPATIRSDVFSFGALLFEMLTGSPPFAGPTLWAVMDATVRKASPPLESLRPDVPLDLSRIVGRCLAKNPDDRYASASNLHADLQAIRSRLTAPAARSRTGRVAMVAMTVGLGLAILGGSALVWTRVRESRIRWAHETVVPEVTRLAEAGDQVGAYRLIQRALAILPNDPQLNELWNRTTPAPIMSDPAGADVAFRAYSGTDEGWIPLGKTPTTERHPIGMLRWRFSKDGYEPIEVGPDHPSFLVHLVPKGKAIPGMVFVGAGSFALDSDTSEVGLPDYWLDKFEVTNRAFKEFIDRGGYRDQRFWREPFVKDGHVISWADAMNEFRDKTGRMGPSTWELGAYPDGQDDWPVSGVSWYEAEAYAAYAGRQLPTVYHWGNASGAFGVFSEILRFSNFGGKGTVRVGSTGGLGPFGTYDMAGNVKEWVWNEATGGRRYVMGGAFNEATYMFRDQDAQLPFDRRPGMGFRCMSQEAPVAAKLAAPIASLERDVSALKPVGDDVYEAYRHLYDYDPIPLEARVDEIDTSNPHWRKERVSFRASYGNERVLASVFVPIDAKPPFQAVVYFPGSDAARLQSSRTLWLQFLEFIIRSGRVVVYPVYQQTYERRVPVRQGQAFLRQIGIQRGQDLRRTIDYLESRPDIDRSRFAFYGLSLGAQLGPVYLAIEPRLRTGVLLSGGFETWTIPPETDPVNFVTRVKQPVLMVNGRDDFDLPYETAQVPMFRMLGTDAADKRHVVFEGGHIPPRPNDIFKEILDWLDRYLGPVGR
jgi:eukaryotic-like serine/threonine-protein kinase